MIIYFSATGNNEYIAKVIASKTNDLAVSITEVKEINLKKDESLGIITPTYFWGLPSIVEDFLCNVLINTNGDNYIYCVATYGTTSGQVDYFIKKHLKMKNIKLNASYSIKTVDNWTVEFSVNDKEYITKTLLKEEEQIVEILNKIENKSCEFISNDKKSVFMCKMARIFYDKARKTSHLNVNDRCINCGLCEKDCPTKAIKIFDGKPLWVKERCTMCFRCLHRCPKFAINYDNKTQKNGQYNR